MIAEVRRWLRFIAADLLHYSGLLRLWMFVRRRILIRNEVCILGLHRVMVEEELARSNSLGGIVLRESTFVEMLRYLRRRFHVVSLDAILTGEAKDVARSRPWCVVTFDDGWGDNYTTAYPWLKRFGMSATIFLTTGFVDGQRLSWVEQLVGAWKDPSQREHIQSHLSRFLHNLEHEDRLEQIIELLKHMPAKEREPMLSRLLPLAEGGTPPAEVDRMLTWDQAEEMSQNGIEFGSHTVTHPLLTYEDDATVGRELRAGKQTLEEKLRTKIRAFAYPNGDWDGRVRQLVERAGYECAFTTRRGWHRRGEDPYTIRRILLHEGNVTGRNGRFSPAMFNLTLVRRG